MKIAIACDHGAYDNKEQLKRKLIQEGYEIEDFGCFSADSVDYPKMAYPCAKAVLIGELFCAAPESGSALSPTRFAASAALTSMIRKAPV